MFYCVFPASFVQSAETVDLGDIPQTPFYPDPLPPTPSPEEMALEQENQPQQTEEVLQECGGNNLLINPSFEGQYSSYVPPGGHPDCSTGTCQTAQMANGWKPYWQSHNSADPGHIIRMPEWKPATSNFTNPRRVRTGERAQQYFSFYSTHKGGIYQRVTNNIQAGKAYCFTIWGHAWSNNADNTYTDPLNHSFLNLRIGIDPTGGTDWRSPNIFWTVPRTQYDQYDLFRVSTFARSNAITVFVYSEPIWAFKHNDVYWDDARLSETTLNLTRRVLLPLVMKKR